MSRARAIAAAAVVCAVSWAGAGCSKPTNPSATEPSIAPPEHRAAAPSVNMAAVTAAATPAALTVAHPPEPKPAPEPPPPRRTVYSLVDNRLSAHLQRGGGLVAVAGSAGFAKYVRFGNLVHGGKKSWELRQSEDGVKVARMNGKQATVFVPLTAAQAGRGTLRLRAFTANGGTLSVQVNGKDEINAVLEHGWSTVDLTVPADQLRDGENALLLTAKAGTELAWVQVGASTPVADDGATAFYDPDKQALLLPADGSMIWYVAMPEHAVLTGGVSGAGCAVSVSATAEDGMTAQGQLIGAGSSVDLAALGGKAVRLELASSDCPSAQLAAASLTVPGELPAVTRGDPPKFVVFMIMDSLRADRVRPFNPSARAETPTFDKLAESSAVFESHYVQGNESQVSHASMWSSNYLAKHRAMYMADHLAEKWMTIDEVAKAGGKFTAGASGNGYIRPSRGFGTRWDKFVNHIEKELGLRGAEIIEQGVSYISPRKDRPWFLYLGLIDTHVTWRAKQPWLERYDPGYKGRYARALGDDGPDGFPKDMTDREKDHVRAIYDSDVSYQDAQLGLLIEKLKTWGAWDKTMLIVTADHGDELWEDGQAGHGGSQRETLLRVPLLIHYPPLFPAVKVTEGSEGIDIVPTLADALGVPADAEWQGQSLVGLANGAGGYPLMSFSSAYEETHAGRIGHWKLKLMGPQSPKLYDLSHDPGEKKDLWGTPSSEIGARMMLDSMWQLRMWNVEWKKAAWGNAADVSSRFAADLGE